MPGLVPRDFVLRSDGLEWLGWQSMNVRQSLDSAAHSFSMTTTDRLSERLSRWNIRGGSEVEILIDGALIFSGYAQKYSVSIGSSDHSISIEGSSKTIDAVECSHLGPYFWKNTTPETIIRQVLEPFGFGANFPAKAMKHIGNTGFKVDVEKSPFEIIKELAERDGLTVMAGLDGNFTLYDGDAGSLAGSISRGQYTSISSDHDLSQAFSEIIVKGQKNERGSVTKGNFDAAQRSERTITNPLKVGNLSNPVALRYRPTVYVQNNEADANEAFGEFVKSRFTGDIITASVTVKSHINPEGDIWQAGQLVWLEEELLSVNQFLVVSDVEFKLDAGGYETTLGLKIPNSYDPLGQPDTLSARRGDGEFGNATRAVWV